jgi:hypothetical protein
LLQDQILALPRIVHRDPFASTKSRQAYNAGNQRGHGFKSIPCCQNRQEESAVTRVALVHAAMQAVVTFREFDEVS